MSFQEKMDDLDVCIQDYAATMQKKFANDPDTFATHGDLETLAHVVCGIFGEIQDCLTELRKELHN